MSTKTKFRETADKAVAVAMAALLALSALTIPAPAVAATPAYESGKSATLSEKLGFDPEEFVANLEKHKDRYLGTPYTMEDREAGPGKGMDCSTFVSYALINEAGVADSALRTDMQPRHSDANCLPNTETLFDWAFENCAVSVYSSKDDLLASEPAKGDILFVWAKSAGKVPVGGADSHVGIYWGEGGGEDLMWHSIPTENKIGPIEGKVAGDLYYAKIPVTHGFDLTVSKSEGTAVTLETSGNGAYAASLAGARYGVYSDARCTDKVGTITVEAHGSRCSGTLEGLDAGTYWVKETKAPAGYALDPAVRKVVLDADKAVESAEDKQYATLEVAVTKLARDGGSAPEGDASFEGALFRIDYPNGKSGTYRADASGRVSMRVADGALVGGDPMDVVDGAYVLQLGTYSVTEVEAPQGCVVPEDATRTVEVTATSQLTPTSTKVTFENEAAGSLGYVQAPALGGVVVAKGDALMFGEGDTGGDGAYYSYAQGDATLAGAEFTVYNASAERVCADVDGDGVVGEGESFAPGEAVVTVATEYDADLDAYVARTAPDLLPYGTYVVRETKAPQGYTADGAVQREFQVREDGAVCELLYADGELNEVAAGGVRVVKSDLELEASEALGGNSHDALSTGSTLSGIEFTVANASAHGVMVSGEWFHVGDDVMTITTRWDEKAREYAAQTAADALPYGTYTVRETATNGSYLLTDGEPRTFEVREDGAVVTADASGEPLEFRDQVVRNDVELSKAAGDTGEALQVAFKVTNASTGEAHVVVTDRNGDFSSASSWNPHSRNTNGNDRLLEAERITADMMDSRAGTWFSLGEDGSEAAVDDSLAALPYGQYVMEELRCDANEGYRLITRAFWVERDSTAAKAVWMSLDDQTGERIGTTLTDAADGDHFVAPGADARVVDDVSYEGLTPGAEYVLHGTLMDKGTGEPLLDASGAPVTATATFTPASASGTAEVEFAFDASLLAGRELVAFETLVREGAEVAAHADIEDGGQTVRVVGIRTTATDAADGDKIVTGPEAVIADKVAYEGLTPGAEHVLTATLVDAGTGEPVSDGAGPVSATVAFTPDEPDGTQVVELALDASALGGRRLVVYEALSLEGTRVASHEDPSDEGQTVTVASIGTTLTDAADGDHVAEAGRATLTDVVEYEGLVPGEAYAVHGTLMVKSTGMPLEDADGNVVTATAEFTPDAPEGAVEVTFEVDLSALAEGEELVAFEECLTAEGNLAAAHQDIDDEAQTVVVDSPDTPEVPDEPGKALDKTGADLLPYAVGVIAALAAGTGCLALCVRTRREGDGDGADAENAENVE